MLYDIYNDSLKATVNDEGAELWSLLDILNDRELIWQGDRTIWPRRSPILFPWCGAIRDGYFELDGRHFPAGIHGFARDYQHRLVSQTKDCLIFELTSSSQTYSKFPFEFVLRSTYSLAGASLTCKLEAFNTGNQAMPAALGFHTGLALPLDSGHAKARWLLEFEPNEGFVLLQANDKGLLTGEQTFWPEARSGMQLTDEPIRNSLILSLPESEGRVIFSQPDSSDRVIVSYTHADRLVLWSTGFPARYLCIEPWNGQPDSEDAPHSILDKTNLKHISPGKSLALTQTLSV